MLPETDADIFEKLVDWFVGWIYKSPTPIIEELTIWFPTKVLEPVVANEPVFITAFNANDAVCANDALIASFE